MMSGSIPKYALDAIMNSGKNGSGGMGSIFGSGLGGGLSTFLSGLFGNSGQPYQDAMDQMQKYFQGAQGFQMPFFQAGSGAIPQYQDWLKGMSDPSKFVNNLQTQYQQSPYNKFLQDQSMRAGTNAASMGGNAMGQGGAGIGSTPFAQQMQQNSSNIAASGMNDWMGNVMHANDQYGAGLSNEIGMGQHAGDFLSNLFSNMGNQMGQGAYGKAQGENQDFGNTMGGLLQMLLSAGMMM